MGSAVAPWLQGLEDAWEVPAGIQLQPTSTSTSTAPISSATHGADSLGTSNSNSHGNSSPGSVRVPKPKHSPPQPRQSSTRSRRSPLAHLSNGSNISRRQTSDGTRGGGDGKLTESRSFSAASDGSTVLHGTVQQRSKSASPLKSQETLEWRQRLVHGQLKYGDQTDLFGPSGLDNIFAQTPQQGSSNAPKKRTGMNWLDRSAVASMPSSPPPWPSRMGLSESGRIEEDEERLTTVGEEYSDRSDQRYAKEKEEEEEEEEEETRDDSYRSHPSEPNLPQKTNNDAQRLSAHNMTSPERFVPTPGHQVGNRTISGRTELEEDFSPVFISKHTTINGTVGYTALDSHTVKQFQAMDINLQHSDQEDSAHKDSAIPEETAQPVDRRQLLVDQSVFTDGDSIATAAPDLSLSENLPTGTPEAAGLGRNVQVKRGGYSAEGSFRERPLSASPEREESELLSSRPGRKHTSTKAKHDCDPPCTPCGGREQVEPRSRSSASPLKLFGPHDTFTSNRLLRRLSQLDPDLSASRSEANSEASNSKQSTPARRVSSLAQSFGSGSLNHHPFPAEITITGASDESGEVLDSDLSPGPDISPPGSRVPMLFKLESSPDGKNAHRVKRKISRQGTTNSRKTSSNVSRHSSARKTSRPMFLQATVEDASDMVSTFEVAAKKVNERRSSSKHLFADPMPGAACDASQRPSSPPKPFSIPVLRGPTRNVRDTCEQPTPGKISSIPVAVGKRPPNSPFKAPTPKRRRTLHASELEADTAEARRSIREHVEHGDFLKSDAADANRSYHEQLQEAIRSQERASTLADAEQKPSVVNVLSQRKISRPRNPTPNQRPGMMSGRVPSTRKEQIEAEIREATEAFVAQDPEGMEAVLEQMETSMASGSPPSIQQQARAVASEVAKFTLRVQKASSGYPSQDRKRSVTTQDFFNEAVMVMRLIREKAGRQSGLGSVAESDQEGVSQEPSEEFENSMLRHSPPRVLQVSRPPSREGAERVSGWRPRTSANTDARVVSHLRRFQDNDDTEFIAPSIASIRVAGESRAVEESQYQDEDVYDEEDEWLVAIDEHSNIRIKGPLPSHQQEDIDHWPTSQHSDQIALHTQSVQSQSSAGERSIKTSCTKKSSDNVGNLAPDQVAHLIGEQVGSMVFDKDKQQWVRVRTGPKKMKRGYGSFLEPPSDATSSDDPFGEISDLPVDERKEEEIRRASTARSSVVSTDRRTQTTIPTQVDVGMSEKLETMHAQVESRTSSQETVVATRPSTRDSDKSQPTHSSFEASRHTGFSSSQQQHETTRATSWGNEELELLANQGKTVVNDQPLVYAAAQAALSLAQMQKNVQSQAVTDQQSLVASLLDSRRGSGAMIHEDSDVLADLRDDTELAEPDADIEELSPLKQRQIHSGNQFKAQPTFRGSRQVSLRRKTLTSLFNDADAMEHSELSFLAALPGERMMSVNMSVSRPLSARTVPGHLVAASSPSKIRDQSFFFSDLPDFTISEEDVERPSEQLLARRLAQHAADEVNDRYALAVKDLVKTLTDVYEEEPYWESMKSLHLRDKSVTSLHGLEDFCGSVQKMDVSNNKLTYLNGAPATIRQLNARQNRLSSLTCWSHLINLQYLDISGNSVESLDGLSCLYHLRELRADDNEITNISGIMELDGLLKLRIRRNKVTNVEFGRSQLQRLEELDLCGNELEAIHSLHELKQLRSLKVDGNPSIGTFIIQERMANLKHLSLRNCGLQKLDVANLPNLQTLLLDGNSLADIDHIEDLQYLDILSMRNQALVPDQEVSILSQPLTARIVRLSGTVITNPDFSTSQLSIQQLEMASVGLQSLPKDFGAHFPNVMSLNLNFNSLRDIRSLLNIQKLEKLELAGNMLGRLRKSVATLSVLKTLREVDLRDNPITQGFYPPNNTTSVCEGRNLVRKTSASEDEDGDGDEDEDEDEAYERRMAAIFHLPPLPLDTDIANGSGTLLAKMDGETTLRKRVYEILIGHCCEDLRILDGVGMNREKAMGRKDEVWGKLVELGIVRKREGEGLGLGSESRSGGERSIGG